MNDKARREFEKLGVRVSVPVKEEEAFEVMSVNWPSFVALLACSTQWRVVGTMAGLCWVGLDYVACRLVLDDLNSPPGVFADLHHMEKAALPILNERDD